MLKAVIFDMDGVLLDSFEAWYKLNSVLLLRMGKKEITQEAFYKNQWGVPLEKKEIEALKNDQKSIETFARSIKIFDGSLLTLDKLKCDYKIGLVTSTPRILVDVVLEHSDMIQYFDAIIALEDAKNPKPAPDGVLQACKLLGVKPDEAIFLGDLPVDVEAGKAAGVKTIAIKPTQGADFSIGSVKELPALLEKISSKKENSK